MQLTARSVSTIHWAHHLTASPFKFVEISVPFAAVGSFVFPFVLFNTMWNALPKNDNKSNTKEA